MTREVWVFYSSGGHIALFTEYKDARECMFNYMKKNSTNFEWKQGTTDDIYIGYCNLNLEESVLYEDEVIWVDQYPVRSNFEEYLEKEEG